MRALPLFAAALLVAACSDSGGGTPSGTPSSAGASGKTPATKTSAGGAPSAAKASASAAGSAGTPSPSASAPLPPEPTKTELTVKTDKGDVVIHSVQHATVYLEVDKKVVFIDPWSEAKLDDKPKADFILITDNHPDHLDEKGIDAVKKDGTKIMGPQVVADKVKGTEVIKNGDKKTFGPFEVEAIPMYNEKRGPETGKLFHDKGRGNGYVLTHGGKRIYFSGDTECIPEMKALKNIEVAFVCMNLPYTMTPEEAGECVAAFKPKILVPYHYRGQDPSKLEPKVKEAGVTVERLKFY
jgi:L-ascorbate metabolism protein UlaG (beta-lactamase superfamily)